MKTTSDKMAVMQAYLDNKKIVCVNRNDNTMVVFTKNDFQPNREPAWDWCTNDYRVVTEPYIRPYKTEGELLMAMLQHGMYVKDGPTIRIIKKFTTMENGTLSISLSGMKDWPANEIPHNEKLVWAYDGSPFGIEEKEDAK